MSDFMRRRAAAMMPKIDNGDVIPFSCILTAASSQYFTKALASPTNNKIYTLSIWVQLASTSGYPAMLCAPGSTDEFIYDHVGHNLQFYQAADSNVRTSAGTFSNTSTFDHICLGIDTTQGTPANRLTLEVNGVTISAFSPATYPSLNYVGTINTAVSHQIGKATGAQYLNAKIAAVRFVDGQKLAASNFGRNGTTKWVPKTYAGTYGTNGFYLDFADSADLGNDVSGNANDWATNGGMNSSNQSTITPTS